MASDDSLDDAVESVVDGHPEAVEDFQAGEDGALNFLVGQVVHRMGGNADPARASALVQEAVADE